MPPGLEAVVDDLSPKDRQVAEYRLARVGELESGFLAVGRAGFRGSPGGPGGRRVVLMARARPAAPGRALLPHSARP